MDTTAKATPHREEQDVGVFTGEDVTTGLNKSVLAFTFHQTSSKMEMQQQLTLTWTHLSKIIPFSIKYDEKWLLKLIQKQCRAPSLQSSSEAPALSGFCEYAKGSRNIKELKDPCACVVGKTARARGWDRPVMVPLCGRPSLG
ncbi:Nuclear RNA export factor 3 [Manis javanica]|nr:Nuclear RNA export factor 3 [Manis javanica]